MMSDDERAMTGRESRRTPRHGVPVTNWDDDVTPPPQEPPQPSSRPGYDSIPPPIKDQLNMLAENLGDATRAIGKIWDARKDGEVFTSIDAKLSTLARSATQSETIIEQYIKPQLDHWRATTDVIARDMPRVLAAVEALTLSVGNLDKRLHEFEVKTEIRAAQTEANHAAIEQRIATAEQADRIHSDRIKAIEDKQLIDDATRRAIAKTSRKAGGAVGAVVATVVSTAAAIASHLAK